MLFPRDTIHKVVDRLRSTHADTVALKFVPSGPMRGSRGQNHRAVAEMNEVNKTTRINNFCSFDFDCECGNNFLFVYNMHCIASEVGINFTHPLPPPRSFLPSPFLAYILYRLYKVRPLPPGFLVDMVLHCHKEMEEDDNVVERV